MSMTKKHLISTAVITSSSLFASLWFGSYMQTTGLAQSTSQYKLPYPAGVTYQISRGNTNDNGSGTGHPSTGASVYAYDFAMPLGRDVVAARAGTVIGLSQSSTVGGCSESLWTKANFVVIDHGGGESTIYAHLNPNSAVVKAGDRVQQGQKIAKSGQTGYTCNGRGGPGPHLHYAVQQTPPPSSNPGNIQNYWKNSIRSTFADPDVLRQNSNGIPTGGKSYKSDNGNNNTPTPSPDIPFQQPNVKSTISINVQSVDLTVTASNLDKKTVYLQMWRPAINGNPAKEWNTSKNVTGTSITFNDLEGPGNTFSGVDYYTVVSLSPIPSGEAAKQRKTCYLETNRTRLCDTIRR